MTTHRKNARLPSESYFGRQTYFITIVCDHRAPHLAAPPEAQRILTILLECAAHRSFQLHAFCIMPDHLHMLAQGTHDASNLGEFIRLFKQRTAFEFRKSQSRQLWEMSYYDHILRSDDPVENVACHIWQNPVRKKLCAQPAEFRFSGSQTIDWMTRSGHDSTWQAPWHPAASKPESLRRSL